MGARVESGNDPGGCVVIRGEDRVSELIDRDDRLIDVLAEAAPVFGRLRNAAMRRVMARMVTVEQAARIAGIDPAHLVKRLNDGARAPGPESESDMTEYLPISGPPPTPRPAALDAADPSAVVDLDVRPELRAGEEPFGRIMAARRSLGPGSVLRLRTIFEPVPLYAVFGKQGFDHWTERLADDDWRIWFYRPEGVAARDDSAERASRDSEDDGRENGPEAASDGVVVLDVRGMEPPEPMLRTLKALETLPADHTLVQINVKEPRFLLPQLTERGFAYDVREQEPGLVRVFIRRAGEGAEEVPGDEDRTERVLDVRVIPPKEKHPAIFETFKALEPGASFVLVNDHDPKPLRYQFQFEHAGEFAWEYLEEGPVVWRVRITRTV
jgi:uncharacterized protein (DUF2249 family)